jgi:hypothetical protein
MVSGFSAFWTGSSSVAIGYLMGFWDPGVTLVRDESPAFMGDPGLLETK